MANKYFNVSIEFDKNVVDDTIVNAIENNIVGYVCSIERNNLTVANKDSSFLDVLNCALINNCDGSVVASIIGKIYHKPFESYIGGDLFLKFIKLRKYRHYFLGNTPEILNGLKNNLVDIDPKIEEMSFETLPFLSVNEFDYNQIAQNINNDAPDCIWISLGAPKQEQFMAKLQPYLNHGVMFGIGAAFNFNSGVGEVHRAPLWMRKHKLEWLHRIIVEPKKNLPRSWAFIKILPSLIIKEQRKIKNYK